MKKRVLSILLSLCMVMALLSGTAMVFAPGKDAPRSDIVYYLYRNSK